MKTHYLLAALLFPLLQPVHAQTVYGCTDPLSSSYNANATVNDGSCTYSSASLTPENSFTLSTVVDETSGLIIWNGSLYTINDDTDTNLYRINPENGNVEQTIAIPGTTNIDWEEIAQDANYIYIGDFGNNASGDRDNLRIVRVSKASLQTNSPVVDYINFSYSNQTSFAATGNNATDFDCEAMVVSNNNIYLFTKQWVGQQTSLYQLPKTPGTYVAQLQDTLNVNGLITAAAYLPDKRLIVLSGYSTLVSPFVYLLYDFQGNNFFGGNKRKIALSQSFHQMEAITTTDGLNYYMTNEHLQQGGLINIAQKLHLVDLTPYLQTYLDAVASLPGALADAGVMIYPAPGGEIVNIEGPQSLQGLGYTFIDMMGRQVLNGILEGQLNAVDVSTLATGTYELIISGFEDDVIKLGIQ